MQYKRVMLTKFGGPEELHLETVDGLPEPAAGEIRVRVLAAGTGFTDTIIRQGQYVDVALFDRYQGKGVPDGQVSLAIQVTIQPREATLTDVQIEAVADRVVAAVAKATGAVLRA